MRVTVQHLTIACAKKQVMNLKLMTGNRGMRRWGNEPELLDENGDAGPSAQTQRAFHSTTDHQATAYMINGDKSSK
jgi:hypothetical protein